MGQWSLLTSLALRSKRKGCSWITVLRSRGTTPLSQLHHNGLHGSTNSAAVAVTEEGLMESTDPKLFKAIETALASGNTVYLIKPDYQSTDDGPELIRNSTLIKGKPGEFPADVFRSANSDQFLRVLKRYARFECEACGRFCRDEYYMLRTELWRKVCRSNHMLCIGCVEDRLGRKLVPTDFNLKETLASATQFPPSRRLKQRLDIGWHKHLNRVLAVIRAKVLALSAKFLSVTARLTQGLMAPPARAPKGQSQQPPNYMVQPEGPVSADQSKSPKGQSESRSRQPRPKGPAQPKAPIETWRLPSQGDHARALSRPPLTENLRQRRGTNRTLSGTYGVFLPTD
jgi:hypothetical protein